ncbi:serine/threonine protein kinase, partial [Candidatus Bathyarchaeota archaeon]|nr:serine/threonine protein kinase [Candidatus Bathyarchaeota archaeon]
LSTIELLMRNHEYAPIEDIIRFTRLKKDDVTHRIGELSKGHFLLKSPERIAYDGYALTYLGYDALALKSLVKSGVLEALGQPLGVGKESDIYEGLDSQGRRCAVKFHRLGRTSFRQTRRKRGYVADRLHITWLYQSRLAAEREYVALKRLYRAGVKVPKPLCHNRHVLVMSLITGTELRYVELEDPKPILKEILRNIRRSYVRANLIHADLSEFNILVKSSGEILIIDWPQCIDVRHPNAHEYLRRDVMNVIKCFKRKVSIDPDLNSTMEYVTGMRRIFRL